MRRRLNIVLIAAGLAISVAVIGILLAVTQAQLTQLHRGSKIALVFSLSMKHTGLALVLAGEILHDQPRVILVILLSTLAQHMTAATVDWRLSRTALATSQ